MSILVADKEPQKLTIDGVKFFKKHLDKIKLDTELMNPITTSEISLFMILHMYTDEVGQIRTLSLDPKTSDRKKLCISNIAVEHSLKYDTVKKAFDRLLEKNYISEVHTDKGMHYEIVEYAKFNQQTPYGVSEEQSSYFRIPAALFNEKLFGELIKHRYHRGPILLLEISQFFSRQIGTNKREVEDIEKIKGIRTMPYLKTALKTTAKRVRDFLSIIKNVFSFNPVNEKVKQPAAERTNRLKSFSQVCIDKFTFTLNSAAYKKNDSQTERQAFSKARKEMSARIKNAKIPLKWREINDISLSISRMVKYSTFFKAVNKGDQMLNFTISQVADELEELHKNDQLSDIDSIGAYANKCFSNAFEDFQKAYISVEDRLEIGSAYSKMYGEYPTFLIRPEYAS